MKLFVLVSRIPWPLEKGDKLRAYHQVTALAKKHQLMLCCLSDQPVDEKAMDHLRTITPHVLVVRLRKWKIGLRLVRALISDKPYQVHYFFQRSAARKVRKAIEDFAPDEILCQLVRTSEYVKHLHQFSKTLDYMDALSAGYQRRQKSGPWWMKPFVREEARRLMVYENLIFEYFEHHTIISRQDLELIMHPRRSEITVVPNGVNTDFFSPRNELKEYMIVFTGNMSYPPNVECARRLALDILPLIHRSLPGARLLIAGATPVSEVKELAGDQVVVTGWLEDIRSAYAGSHIFMAPMKSGSGLQNKLLEAMSMEMPCITTSLAANAMGTGESGMIVAEGDQELANAAIRLMSDEALRQLHGRLARTFVMENFGWRQQIEVLESCWKKP